MHHAALNRLCLFLIGFVLLALGPAAAQERQLAEDSDVIILFDSSASMLVEVDGTPKIDLAREAANSLLDSLPAGRRVGLVTVGPGSRTLCGSIETPVPLGGDRELVRKTLADATPRGFTPLSSAIEQVAEDYAGSARPIEIVLFSDGGDQCFRDPCEVAKKLEAANARFTAHVVAAGDGDEIKLPELKCIAEVTGGRLVSPAEVTELVGLTPPAVPDEEETDASVQLVATDAATGEPLGEDVQWLIIGSESEDIIYRGTGSGVGLDVEIAPGTYDFVVITEDEERGAARRITIDPGAERSITVPVERKTEEPVEETPPPATLEERPPAPVEEVEEEPAAARLRLVATDLETGARLQEDVEWLIINSDSEDVVYRGKGPGDGLTVDIPPGTYDFVVITQAGERGDLRRLTLAPGIVRGVVVPVRRTVRETPPPATIDERPPVTEATPPVIEEADEVVELRLIATDAAADTPIRDTVAWTVTNRETGRTVYRGKGNGTGITIEVAPGVYDFTAQIATGERGMARSVEVQPGFPQTVIVTIERKQTQETSPPAIIDDGPSTTIDPTRRPPELNPPVTDRGPSVNETEPPQVAEEEKLARFRLLAIDAATVKPIGEAIDWIVVRTRTEDVVYRGKDSGSGITIELPTGTYDFRATTASGDRGEVRGMLVLPGVTQVVTVPIKRSAQASLRLRTDGRIYVGTDLVVDWQGPGQRGDYIAIARPNDQREEETARISDARRVTIRVPLLPGRYEVRYVMGQSGEVIARQPIDVIDVGADLSGPRQVRTGETFRVSWQGPGHKDDRITISAPRARASSFMDAAYAGEGNPVTLTAPKNAGRYQLQYWLRGERLIATQNIDVVADTPPVINRRLQEVPNRQLERLPQQQPQRQQPAPQRQQPQRQPQPQPDKERPR
ncbi:vWA domain-containing protein [Parvularcula marina]|uniref:VWA domain-containing protein n=1 Tax=Parvularcula marina TaxID=2292771 RepID=A0A371RJT0_9PROT|nr:VWA domain-containing protein [Parvularcula marina]RFB05699.1 VWA domain-containing protein [Parvularcula marina]